MYYGLSWLVNTPARQEPITPPKPYAIKLILNIFWEPVSESFLDSTHIRAFVTVNIQV